MFSTRVMLAVVAASLVVSALSVAVTLTATGALGDGDEVRLTARRLADYRVELGIQERHADGWGEIMLPEARFLPAGAAAGRWLHSSAIELAGPREEALYCFVTHEHPSDLAFWGQVEAGATRFADEMGGIDLRLVGSPETQGQARLIAQCVEDGAVAIASSLPDPQGLRAALLAAIEAGVIVNSFNSGLESFTEVGSLRHVSVDDVEIGRQAARRFIEAGLRGTVLCILHERANVGLSNRCDGFDEVYPGPVERFAAHESGVSDLQATEAAIASRLGQAGAASAVAGVFSLNAAITEAVLAARRLAGSDAVVASVDANLGVLRGIERGEILFAVDSQAFIQGWLTMASLRSAVNLKHRAIAAGFEGNVLQHISRFIGGTPVVLGVVVTTRENVAARIGLLTNTGRRGWAED